MPLSGIRVVDLTRILAVPFCTMMLADMGADVIKVETPGVGDPLRQQGAIRDGLSWYFAGFNRNKRSLSQNLRSDGGKAVLARLIAQSDVLVDGWYNPDQDGTWSVADYAELRLPNVDPKRRELVLELVSRVFGTSVAGPATVEVLVNQAMAARIQFQNDLGAAGLRQRVGNLLDHHQPPIISVLAAPGGTMG